jgi:hypothetical protein
MGLSKYFWHAEIVSRRNRQPRTLNSGCPVSFSPMLNAYAKRPEYLKRRILKVITTSARI